MNWLHLDDEKPRRHGQRCLVWRLRTDIAYWNADAGEFYEAVDGRITPLPWVRHWMPEPPGPDTEPQPTHNET